jgi:hypothetical protein
LPAVYPYRFFASSGGFISYGIDLADQYRRAASYVDLILRGAKPGDLPVQLSDSKAARQRDWRNASPFLAILVKPITALIIHL